MKGRIQLIGSKDAGLLGRTKISVERWRRTSHVVVRRLCWLDDDGFACCRGACLVGWMSCQFALLCLHSRAGKGKGKEEGTRAGRELNKGKRTRDCDPGLTTFEQRCRLPTLSPRTISRTIPIMRSSAGATQRLLPRAASAAGCLPLPRRLCALWTMRRPRGTTITTVGTIRARGSWPRWENGWSASARRQPPGS